MSALVRPNTLAMDRQWTIAEWQAIWIYIPDGGLPISFEFISIDQANDYEKLLGPGPNGLPFGEQKFCVEKKIGGRQLPRRKVADVVFLRLGIGRTIEIWSCNEQLTSYFYAQCRRSAKILYYQADERPVGIDTRKYRSVRVDVGAQLLLGGLAQVQKGAPQHPDCRHGCCCGNISAQRRNPSLHAALARRAPLPIHDVHARLNITHPAPLARAAA